jgi:hypothetical protein
VTYRLDPVKMIAVKVAAAGIPVGPASPAGPGGVGRGGRGDGSPDSNSDAAAKLRQALDNLQQLAATVQAAKDEAKKNGGNVTVEDLGALTVNGISAHGTRVTTLVPIGAIGNDREFRSVTERWFSSDLNLLVKSVSTDPRFGTTTYELTNISRQPPDPALFQVPGDYRVLGDPSAQPQPTQPSTKLIEEIEVRGAKSAPGDSMKALLHSKVGDVFNETTLRNDFAALWKTGRFNDVQVKTETGPRGGVVIQFVVTER